jgi:hypothetical protein
MIVLRYKYVLDIICVEIWLSQYRFLLQCSNLLGFV